MSQYSKNRNSRLNARYCGLIDHCFVCGNRKIKGFTQVIIEPQLSQFALFDKAGIILNGDSKTWGLEAAHTVRLSVILCKPCTKRLAARLEKAIDTGELEGMRN